MTVAIRPATRADVPAIADIYNEAILTTTATFDTEPKTIEDRMNWFDAHGERHPVFVATVDGRVVGWSSISKWSDRCAYDDTAETSFYVAEKNRGQGIGRQLKEATIAAARRLGFHSLIARVAGFVPVGTLHQVGMKFGRRLDVHILQLMLNEANTTP